MRDPLRHYTDEEFERGTQRLLRDIRCADAEHGQPIVIRHAGRVNPEDHASDGLPRPESDCEL